MNGSGPASGVKEYIKKIFEEAGASEYFPKFIVCISRGYKDADGFFQYLSQIDPEKRRGAIETELKNYLDVLETEKAKRRLPPKIKIGFDAETTALANELQMLIFGKLATALTHNFQIRIEKELRNGAKEAEAFRDGMMRYASDELPPDN